MNLAQLEVIRHQDAMAPLFPSSSQFFLSVGALLALGSTVACSPAVVAEKPAKVPFEVVHLEEAPPLEASTGEMAERQSPRRVGDVFVHRFSGSYRGEAIVLREEVLTLANNVITVDYQMQDGEKETHLRVEMGARTERVIAVHFVEGDELRRAEVSDYEKMLEKTLFVPDQNNGKVADLGQTCLIGKAELDCEITEYEVRVGEQEAKLSVARSEEMGRDVSGEVVAVDGTVLYHAELLEMQRGDEVPGAGASSVAMNDAAK